MSSRTVKRIGASDGHDIMCYENVGPKFEAILQLSLFLLMPNRSDLILSLIKRNKQAIIILLQGFNERWWDAPDLKSKNFCLRKVVLVPNFILITSLSSNCRKYNIPQDPVSAFRCFSHWVPSPASVHERSWQLSHAHAWTSELQRQLLMVQ